MPTVLSLMEVSTNMPDALPPITAELMTMDGATKYMLVSNPPPLFVIMPVYVPIRAMLLSESDAELHIPPTRRYELYRCDEYGIHYYREVA
jgi:hypothetical protein